MEIRVDAPGLAVLQAFSKQFPAIIEDEINRALRAAVLVAEDEIVQRTPVDTGRLRGAIASEVRGDEARVFAQNVPYALHVEAGTRAHVIRARNRRMLKFRAGGRVVFRRQVNHPGTRGSFMFRDGAKAAEPEIQRIFEDAVGRAIARIGRADR